MLRRLAGPRIAVLCLLLIGGASFPSIDPSPRRTQSGDAVAKLILRETRTSPLDLEVKGDLAGLPVGAVRYLTRQDLLGLPQVSYTVTDDANFTGPTEISGAPLEELLQYVSGSPKSDMVVAICEDKYQASYPRAYLTAHHPLLVFEMNRKSPKDWSKDPEGHGLDMGPYLISHAKFSPSFKILSHSDEPQIPWGVVRLEFNDEQKLIGSIAPRGPHAGDASIQAGYRIAQQNCFRCHNLGAEGGQKAGRSWFVLATWAVASPEYFSAYIRNPKSKDPHAEMPGNPNYDDGTVQALTAYFRTFGAQEKP